MLNLHSILPRSRANGPGIRMVIWFQGCSLRCPGCFNPDTQPDKPQLVMPVGKLAGRIAAEQHEIEGITITGGEPLQQPEALLKLLAEVWASSTLSVLLFSGYSLYEIVKLTLGPEILKHVDVLIAGRYDRSQRFAERLRGSSNQSVHCLTDRYTIDDLTSVPPTEIVITPQGSVVFSGIDPVME